MRIAVTGGYGFIGSRLVKRLLNDGHEVFILDNMSTPVVDDLATETICCDITNKVSLERARLDNIDLLLHLAAQSSPFVAFNEPQLDVNINVIGTLNMIDWCRSNNVPRFIYASSFTAYGDHHKCERLNEEMHDKPKSVYGLSKKTSEQMLRIYAEPHDIAWNALRMFNVYGPGQDISRTDQGMVSIFLGMLQNQNHLGIKGSLKRFRDFVYIDDVIEGWMCCINNQHPAFDNRSYNLGSGNKTYIDELLDTLIYATGKSGQVTYAEEGTTPGDILGCYADISNLKSDLGYVPQWSLDEGVKEMVNWVNSNVS